jgi:hypothetical protein
VHNAVFGRVVIRNDGLAEAIGCQPYLVRIEAEVTECWMEPVATGETIPLEWRPQFPAFWQCNSALVAMVLLSAQYWIGHLDSLN